jgi:hypothetical protein
VRSVRLLLGAVVLFSCACATRPAPVAQPNSEVAVLAALLDSWYRNGLPDTLVVWDSTLSFRPPENPTNPSWIAQYDSLPRELVVELARISAQRASAARLELPRPVRLLSATEHRQIFREGPRGWPEFHRRFPSARAYFAFTPVVFGPGGRDALVYFEYHCGGLCGGGNLVWLQSAEQSWRVRQRVEFWVS